MRWLDPDRDEPALRTFRCARLREPWAIDVQDAIRDALADAVRAGYSACLVCTDGDQLVGVATLMKPNVADDLRMGYASILATSITHRRRGVARALKLAVMQEARRRGYRFLESRVHEDNQAMLGLNRSLAADMRRLPPGPEWSAPDHISCVIKL